LDTSENQGVPIRGLVAGAFGARSVWIMRARAGSFRRCLRARLGAAYRPPSGGVLGQFTHFGAASGGFRFRAMAIAATDRWLAKLTGGVGEGGKGQGTREQRKVQRGPDGKSAKTAKEWRRHTEAVSNRNRKKPIAQTYCEFCYRGHGTKWERRGNEGHASKRSSVMNLEDDFGTGSVSPRSS
jgi:hypothetical protein